MSVIQFLINNGYSIPRFCYHGLLSIAGNCRVCVVDDREFKTSVSCALCYETYRAESFNMGAIIGIFVKNAISVREYVFEFLLLSHPLDCPICDRGGECELQDMTNSFGSDGGRTKIKKNTINDKLFTIVVSTHMSRCITCGRCVRFLREITQNFTLGIVGRGNICEVSNYVSNIDTNYNVFTSNIIDLCPVIHLYKINIFYKVIHILDSMYISTFVLRMRYNHYLYMSKYLRGNINYFTLRLYFSLPVTFNSRYLVDDVYECVLCASCSASCPSYWWNQNSYLGPAILLQSYKWIFSSNDSNIYNRLNSLNFGYNISLCHGIGNCKIVCPKNLDPSRRISELKSVLGFSSQSMYYV